MCGIAGFQGKFDKALLARMNAVQAHRGPDDAGLWHEAATGTGFAHRRLAIIDPHPAGRQPMWDVAHTVCVAFNGEIYNYRELRAGLIAAGFQFQNATDTEVLLNLYLRDGTAMLKQLNGMFAFALYDSRNGGLLLARDGFGIKPLYYAQTPQGFLFASEIKALLQEPSLPRAVDPIAVHHTLTYCSVPPPRTVLQAVRKFAPGQALWVRGGQVEKTWSFYDLPYDQPLADIRPKIAIEQLRLALRAAVERQMVADVPVGAFLSGGLDSSSVVAFACRVAARQNRRLQCFTIGYDKADSEIDGMTPDLAYARQVAEHLNVDLHEVTIAPNLLDRLDAMIYHCDEPLPDPAAINVQLIAELAREKGIKVLLSGTGGDDLFSGYRRHYALQLEKVWNWLPRAGRRTLKRAARLAPAGTAVGRRVAKAFNYADLTGDARIAGYFHWIDPEWQMSLYSESMRAAIGEQPFSAPLMESLGRLPESTPPLNRMLYLDLKHYMADYSLTYTDKMSMAAGVEVRVPLLDPELVDLATRLPVEFKQKGRVGKWIFKKAMEGILPKEVIHRPKTGFGAPLRAWIKGPLTPLVDETLSAANLTAGGLFDPAGVAKLVAADRAGQIDAAYPILALICIERWRKKNLDGRG